MKKILLFVIVPLLVLTMGCAKQLGIGGYQVSIPKYDSERTLSVVLSGVQENESLKSIFDSFPADEKKNIHMSATRGVVVLIVKTTGGSTVRVPREILNKCDIVHVTVCNHYVEILSDRWVNQRTASNFN